MTQDQANVIATLTAAMKAADGMNNQILVRQLQKQIDILLPSVEESASCVSGGDNGKPMTEEDKFIAFVGDRCPCCILTDFVVNGTPIGMATDEFIYKLGKTAGYEELVHTMESSGEKIKDGLLSKSESEPAYKDGAMRFADFSLDGIKARTKLAEEGLAPEGGVGLLILEALLKAKADALREKLGQ